MWQTKRDYMFILQTIAGVRHRTTLTAANSCGSNNDSESHKMSVQPIIICSFYPCSWPQMVQHQHSRHKTDLMEQVVVFTLARMWPWSTRRTPVFRRETQQLYMGKKRRWLGKCSRVYIHISFYLKWMFVTWRVPLMYGGPAVFPCEDWERMWL